MGVGPFRASHCACSERPIHESDTLAPPPVAEECALSVVPSSESVVPHGRALSSEELDDFFVMLVRTYHSAVVGYIYSMVSEVQQAEDLAQDAFVKAYLALPRIGAPDNPQAWLFRIATNTTIDHVRRCRRQPWQALGWLSGALRGASPPPSVEEADAIGRALQALSPKDQALLMLFAHSGLNAAEVGEVLGITPAAARKRRQRAREAFTRAYREQQP
jgi:RNA polymerase sigma factor (sigma-70 family)